MFREFTLNLSGRLRVCSRPQIMGIINATPDSFYSGSRTPDADDISRRAEQMIFDGADMIDIGAYSSRPGADDVSVDEELRRISAGIKAVRRVSGDIPVSVDTFRSQVVRLAVEQGADIINDISGGTLDNDMFATVAELKVPYVLMHMRGTPATMQQLTDYGDVTAEVIDDLSRKLRTLRLMGVGDVIVDPGFGFSKTLDQNYKLLKDIGVIAESLNAPVLVGVSRKSMITGLLGIGSDEALNGTTVLNTIAMMHGASFLRVHDVKEASQAQKIITKWNTSA